MDTLEGRVVVVTGGASGIGLALARQAASLGARIVLADSDAAGLQAARANLGGDPLVVPTDVRDRAQVEALRDAALARFGAVHLICNNAGIGGQMGASWELAPQAWRDVMDVNLTGVINGLSVFVPLLVEQDAGHVLNTASMAGLLPLPFGAPYTAAKHAVVGLTASLRAELLARHSRVGVSVLCPGWTRTSIAASGGLAQTATDDLAAGAMAGFVASAVADGADADDVAATAIQAVLTGRYWVLTHADQAAAVLPRYAQAVEGAGLIHTRPSPGPT